MSETIKERYAIESENNSMESPASIPDVIIKKIEEMITDEESLFEDKNLDKPIEYLCTMAEEGKEDTPLEEDSNAINDVESVSSTEYEFDKHVFICDDGEESLLSGKEYDLNTEIKSPLGNYDDIKIQQEENIKPVEKKGSRILPTIDSSESNEDEAELYKVVNDSEEIKSVKESPGTQEVICVEEKADEEIFTVETKPTATNLEESPNVNGIENPGTQQCTEKKKLPSITIHENIDVKEIKDSPLRKQIAHIIDSFCTSMGKGKISMNLSIKCCAEDDKSGKEIENNKKAKKRRLSNSTEHNANIEEETSSRRLSVSMNKSTEAKKRARKRKLRKSNDNLDQIETKSKRKKTNKKMKNIGKKTVKSPKRSTLLEDHIRRRSLLFINQLITDIKNRPRYTMKPSTDMNNNSWITEVARVKLTISGSTLAFDKVKKAAYKSGKVHPKDFRSGMPNDPRRVKKSGTNNSSITEVAYGKPLTSAFDKEEKTVYKQGKIHPMDFRSQMVNDLIFQEVRQLKLKDF